ncbi:MAG: hypothetical protein WBO14_14180, partial [Gammaproteobacteria bacterium]
MDWMDEYRRLIISRYKPFVSFALARLYAIGGLDRLFAAHGVDNKSNNARYQQSDDVLDMEQTV